MRRDFRLPCRPACKLRAASSPFAAYTYSDMCAAAGFTTRRNRLVVANQGSAEAESFEKRLAPFLEYAYRFAFGVLQKREEAEDAVQIAALKAWRSYASFDPDRDFRPWFVSIVYNECRSLRRSRWWSTLIVPHFGRRHDATPDHLEIGLDVRRALGRLRTVDRSAVVL